MMFVRLLVLFASLGLLAACGDDDGASGTGGSGGSGANGGSGGSGGTGGGQPLTDCVEITTPTGAPTFDAVFDEVLCTNTCTDSFCHGPTGAGRLKMYRREAAYANLVGVLAGGDECETSGSTRVVPGDAAASLLVQKLRPDPVCGDVMPMGADVSGEGFVSAAQIAQIEAWINAGALRNPPAELDAGEDDASTNDAGN